MLLVLSFPSEQSSYDKIRGSKCNPSETTRRDICGMACWAEKILHLVNPLVHNHNNSD